MDERPYDISEREYERSMESSPSSLFRVWRVVLAVVFVLVLVTGIFLNPDKFNDAMHGTAEEQRQLEIDKRHLNIRMAFNNCVEYAGAKGPVGGDTVRACKEVADSFYPEDSEVSP